MNIIMTAHPREPSYLDATLESLFTSDTSIREINLLVHETNPECIGRWREDPQVKWSCISIEEREAKDRLHRRTKVAHATRLALETIDGECILLQDDAVFSQDWLKTFEQELDTFGPTRTWSCIAICHHLKHQIKDGILPWDPRGYWGLVAMYFGSVARQKFVEALKAWEAKAWPVPGQGADMCLRDMLVRTRDVRLFAQYPALVTHIGHVSSIGSPGAKRRALAKKSPRPPVTFVNHSTKTPTSTSVQVKHPGGVTTKVRKSARAPVSFIKK